MLIVWTLTAFGADLSSYADGATVDVAAMSCAPSEPYGPICSAQATWDGDSGVVETRVCGGKAKGLHFSVVVHKDTPQARENARRWEQHGAQFTSGDPLQQATEIARKWTMRLEEAGWVRDVRKDGSPSATFRKADEKRRLEATGGSEWAKVSYEIVPLGVCSK